jgi:hypothetical protein
MSQGLIRVGDTVINLDNVLEIDLNWTGDSKEDDEVPHVMIDFALRGWDELEGGENHAYPLVRTFKGDEAEALRKYLKKRCPDLLDM